MLNCSFFEQFKDLENEYEADKVIKTPINDNEKKSVLHYREAIYSSYVMQNGKKTPDEISKKL